MRNRAIDIDRVYTAGWMLGNRCRSEFNVGDFFRRSVIAAGLTERGGNGAGLANNDQPTKTPHTRKQLVHRQSVTAVDM